MGMFSCLPPWFPYHLFFFYIYILTFPSAITKTNNNKKEISLATYIIANQINILFLDFIIVNKKVRSV